MKNKYLGAIALACILSSAVFLISCGGDDDPTPGIELVDVVATGMAGQEVSVTVTIASESNFESLVITKLWDGVSQGTETITELSTNPFTFTYEITEEDADNILSFNFLVTDKKGKTVSRDWVVTVELTARQLLIKHDWRLSDEIRKKTNTSDIAAVYQDDIYRFNVDGTYQKSNGGTADDFNDGWYNYCYYDVNNTTLRLLMSRTGAFGEDEVDIVDITLIDETQIKADVTYFGLNELDPTYDAEEDYEKQFVQVAKTASFDPYGVGTEDDGGPAGDTCIEKVFEN